MATVLSSSRGRHRVTKRIAHCDGFDERYMIDVGGPYFAPAIHALLVQRGAPPTCHVVAEHTEIDDRQLPLAETLEYVHGYAPAILICVPGRLAYYEPEEPGLRFILQR